MHLMVLDPDPLLRPHSYISAWPVAVAVHVCSLCIMCVSAFYVIWNEQEETLSTVQTPHVKKSTNKCEIWNNKETQIKLWVYYLPLFSDEIHRKHEVCCCPIIRINLWDGVKLSVQSTIWKHLVHIPISCQSVTTRLVHNWTDHYTSNKLVIWTPTEYWSRVQVLRVHLKALWQAFIECNASLTIKHLQSKLATLCQISSSADFKTHDYIKVIYDNQ